MMNFLWLCKHTSQLRALMPAICFVALHSLACLFPLFQEGSHAATMQASVDWPERFQGKALTQIGLTQQEQRFSREFPGMMQRFTDGEREIVMRHIVAPSRKVHPVADCLKGAGYNVIPLPISVSPDGSLWGCMSAVQSSAQKKICERITDNQGNEWTDASSWYWSAILGRTKGPWQAVIVVQERTT